MDHMKDNFGELLAAISGASSKDAAPHPTSSSSSSSSRRVNQTQPPQQQQHVEYQNQQQYNQQPQQQQYQQPQQQQYQQPPQQIDYQPQYVWQAQPTPQLQPQYGYAMPQPPHPPQHPPHQMGQMRMPPMEPQALPPPTSTTVKGVEVKATKKSFPVVLLTVSIIVLGFGVLAAWYYSKKSVLADSVPAVIEEAARLPPPKLFLVSEQEEADKLLQDSHVIENLERYLSSPPTTTATTDAKTSKLSTPPPVNVNSNSKNRFTKLSDVIAEEEEEQKPVEEVEVEVNGFKRKMPKRIDSDSPEINDFMKRREQAEKENLKWIEFQRSHGSNGQSGLNDES